MAVEFLPVVPERLADLERFSAVYGKFRYCFDMCWRLTSSAYKASRASA